MSDSAVLFDIDGTLLDSTYLHTHAWRLAFLEVGRNVATARIHRRIGMGSDLLLAELLGSADEAVLAAAKEAHRRHFDDLKPHLRPLDGAVELLARVGARGVRVVLASSAGASELPALLATLEAGEHVDVVTSGADVGQAKPDPEVFQVAISRAGVEPQRCVAVGDAVWDVVAAARLGIATVGVLSGGIGRAELSAAGAVEVYRDVAELNERLDSSALSRLWS